jgi:hypothetical protein
MGTYDNPTVFTPEQQGGGGAGQGAAFQMIQQLIAQNQAKKQKRLAVAEKKEAAHTKAYGNLFDSGEQRNRENLASLNIGKEQKHGLQKTYRNDMKRIQANINKQRRANPNMSDNEIRDLYNDAVMEVDAATESLSLLAMINKEAKEMIKSGKTPIGGNAAIFSALTPQGENFGTIYNADDNQHYIRYNDAEGNEQLISTAQMRDDLSRAEGFFNTAESLEQTPSKENPAYPLYEFTQDEEKMAPYLNKDGTVKREELEDFMIKEGMLEGFNDPAVGASYFAGFKGSTGAFVDREPTAFDVDFDGAQWAVDLNAPTPTGQILDVYTEVLDFYLPPASTSKSKTTNKNKSNKDEEEVDKLIAAKKTKKKVDEAAVEETVAGITEINPPKTSVMGFPIE